MTDRVLPASRPVRIALLTATGFFLLAFVLELIWLYPYIDAQASIGADHGYYKRVGEVWLDTGQFYLPHQLAGPYVVETMVEVLYPPLAIPFFAAWHWLPYPLWWAIPIAIVGGLVWHWRPAAWTWPLLAFLLAWPRGASNLLYGNSDMWVVAAIAGGLAIGWPAVLVLLKPSVAPLALVGAGHRSWWIALAVLAVASLFALDLWRDYLTALGNSDLRWWYSLEDMPPMFIPIVAWLGRRDGGFATVRELLAWRPTLPTFARLGASSTRP